MASLSQRLAMITHTPTGTQMPAGASYQKKAMAETSPIVTGGPQARIIVAEDCAQSVAGRERAGS